MMEVEIAHSAAELRAWTDAHERLARSAAEPNVFHEPWMLVPALEHLSGPEVFVVGVRDRHGLAGVFPLVHGDRVARLPVAHTAIWRHRLCFLSTPLVRADVVRETWAALFAWLVEHPEGRVLRVEGLSTEGPVAAAMQAVAAQMMMPVREQDVHARAFLSRHEAADVYLEHAISPKKRKEYRRQRNRLGELGPVLWERFDDTSDADAWADDFLRLERAGWKGREGSAIALHADQTAFVRAVVQSAAARGRLIAQRVRLDGTTIAIKLSLSATPTTHGVHGGFAFKIAYDEAFSRFSPGVLLELDNLRHVLDVSPLGWMDSCADPHHPMIDHLWRERRTISTALVGLSPLGRLGVPLLSAVLASYHALTRRTHDPVARDR